MAFLGVGGITIFVVSFIIFFIGKISEDDREINIQPFPKDWTQAMSVLPTLMLAFAFQMNFFPIFKGMA